MGEKDKNEFDRITDSLGNSKIEINNITFDLSLGIKKVTDEKLDKLLKHINTIHTVTIKGVIYDCAENVRYITDKLKAHNIAVSNVDIVTEM